MASPMHSLAGIDVATVLAAPALPERGLRAASGAEPQAPLQARPGFVLPPAAEPASIGDDGMEESDELNFGSDSIGNTYQPSVKRRKRRYGYLHRLRSTLGRKIVNRRRSKGRRDIAA
ncbi:hypothetical protein FNF28_00148 [Cafeteria roenbergensis]|nr:hypothetical protein FNF28_00148 [Cafeteria roenbergensis]